MQDFFGGGGTSLEEFLYCNGGGEIGEFGGFCGGEICTEAECNRADGGVACAYGVNFVRNWYGGQLSQALRIGY